MCPDAADPPCEEYGQSDDMRRVQSCDRPRGWHTAGRQRTVPPWRDRPFGTRSAEFAPEVIGLKVPPHGGVHAPPEEDIGAFGYVAVVDVRRPAAHMPGQVAEVRDAPPPPQKACGVQILGRARDLALQLPS